MSQSQNNEGVAIVMGPQEQIGNFLELPADLITEDPESFKQWLLAALVAHSPTILTGRNVTRVGTAALQLLVAFRRQCEVQAVQYELRDASPALRDTLACLGLAHEVGLVHHP
ncbi:MAG: STAS domain-containing protein [Polyangiaceae bacterium]